MTFKSNIAELKRYKSVAPDGNKLKIENVIDLYQKKKIPNYKSALNAVVALSSKHKATVASKKPEKLYESLMEKYETAESLTGRLSRPPAFSVRTGNHSKVKFYIQFEFNYKPDDEDIEKRTLKQMCPLPREQTLHATGKGFRGEVLHEGEVEAVCLVGEGKTKR